MIRRGNEGLLVCLYYVEVSHLPTELSGFTGNSYFASCNSISWIKRRYEGKDHFKIEKKQ